MCLAPLLFVERLTHLSVSDFGVGVVPPAMTQTREKGSVFDGMKVSVLESRLKLRDMEIKTLKKENETLQSKLNAMKYFNKYGNKSMRSKQQNSWKRAKTKS